MVRWVVVGLLCVVITPAQEVKQSDKGRVYKVGSDVSAPVVIFKAQPKYPEKQRKVRKQRTVTLSFTVDSDGGTKDIEVKRSASEELDRIAVDAVREWKFIPAKKKGKPVAVRVQTDIQFHLY